MKSYFLLIIIFYQSLLFSQTISLNKVASTDPGEILISKHTFYEIGFNTRYHLPAWTIYTLSREHLQLANLERKGSFTKDPALSALQAGNKDYISSGFDKGHMVPCEDMSFSELAMKETFYYSNCVPQTTELNRGEWKVLEELCRNWAKEYGNIIVISGPVMKKGLPALGEDKIPVPEYCYKIILQYNSQNYKAIAFLMPNITSTLNALPDYVCTVDSVEKLTGLDFFTELPDNLENKFESYSNKNDWNFVYDHRHSKDTDNPVSDNASVQCKAITKKGVRCKKTTSSSDGFCNLHHK